MAGPALLLIHWVKINLAFRAEERWQCQNPRNLPFSSSVCSGSHTQRSLPEETVQAVPAGSAGLSY